MCFMCFDTKPPAEVSARGPTAAKQNEILQMQNRPNEFAIGMMAAPGKEPLAFCASCLTACCGFPACYYRKKVLETFGRGVEDYTCFQGYIGPACGMDPASMCKSCDGSMAALVCEGCCCPVTSLSIARMQLMDARDLHPDPVDYQLIHLSNACQLMSCVCDIVAIFVEDLRECAQILDVIADCITLSVSGCMGAQIEHELKQSAPTAYQMQRD